MEPTKIRKTQKRTKIDFDLGRDRIHGPSLDSLENISTRAECFHTPDLLRHIGSDYRGDAIVHSYRCSCGRTVKETFKHSRTSVFD